MSTTELLKVLDDVLYAVRVRGASLSGQAGGGCTWYTKPDPENPDRTCRDALVARATEAIAEYGLAAAIAETIIKEDQAGVMMTYID